MSQGRGKVLAGQAESLGRAEMPGIADLTCVRAASVSWAQALSQRLSKAGISHRI